MVEKKNFEKYSLILEYAQLSFPILNNYSAKKHRPYPQATVIHMFQKFHCCKKIKRPYYK
jgi:hypothetical protein